MARVDFYRLTRDPAVRVAAMLASRILDQRGRLLIVADDEGQRGAISRALWDHRDDAFLAHGPADGADAAIEPILIGAMLKAAPANGAAMVILADGLWRPAALDFSRSFLLFDDAQIEDARAAWRDIAAVDAVEAHYWLQDARGKWQEGPSRR